MPGAALPASATDTSAWRCSPRVGHGGPAQVVMVPFPPKVLLERWPFKGAWLRKNRKAPEPRPEAAWFPLVFPSRDRQQRVAGRSLPGKQQRNKVETLCKCGWCGREPEIATLIPSGTGQV